MPNIRIIGFLLVSASIAAGARSEEVYRVEWSVYPFYCHHAIEMPQRPSFTMKNSIVSPAKPNP